MAHFLCHLGAHILEPFCSISILPKTYVPFNLSEYMTLIQKQTVIIYRIIYFENGFYLLYLRYIHIYERHG